RALPQGIEGVGRAGITGDDDGLHPLLHQPVRDFPAVAAHRLGRFGTVWHPGGIAEVKGRFVGKVFQDRVNYGETAEPGIEDSDRCRLHGTRRGIAACKPPPRGTARSPTSAGKSWRWLLTKASSPAKRCLKARSTSQSCRSCRLLAREVESEPIRSR